MSKYFDKVEYLEFVLPNNIEHMCDVMQSCKKTLLQAEESVDWCTVCTKALPKCHTLNHACAMALRKGCFWRNCFTLAKICWCISSNSTLAEFFYSINHHL